MKTIKQILLFTLSLGLISSTCLADIPDELLLKLPEAKLSLKEGVEQIAYEHGPAISAKFELKQGILKLSVYTVQDGMNIGAEKNRLLELIGDSTRANWSPSRVEFADKPHIARASVQLSLLQLSQYSFDEIVNLVGNHIQGMIYSVKPKIINAQALVEVKVLVAINESHTVFFNLMTGEISR